MNAQRLIHAARVKRAPKLTAKSDKPGGNGKRVRARKVTDSYGNGACTQGLSTTYLYSANTGKVGHGSEV